MGLVARFLQQVGRAPDDHFFPERQERLQHLNNAHLFRPAAVQRQHVHAETCLQLGEPEQLVQNNIGIGIPFDIHDKAHAVPIRFVVCAGNTLDLLVARQLADLLEHLLLVDLVRHFGEYEGLAVIAAGFDVMARAHHHRSTSGPERLIDPGPPHDQRAGRKIRTGHHFHDFLKRRFRIFDQLVASIDHLTQVMRRDIGRHADGDAAGAVDQQVRITRRQDNRFLARLVIVFLEVDGFLVDVLQQCLGRFRQARLGIPHGSRRIAIHRAEVALTVDQRQTHGEGLRHTHQRVVDRLIAMRVILAHHIADDQRRFPVGPVTGIAAFAHRIENPAVNRLQPVAHIGNGARHDYAHGVVEVRALHLLLDGNGRNIAFRRRRFSHDGSVSELGGRNGLPALQNHLKSTQKSDLIGEARLERGTNRKTPQNLACGAGYDNNMMCFAANCDGDAAGVTGYDR